MRTFVVVLLSALSFFTTGCGVVIEATKSSLSGIKISSPVVDQLGFRAESHKLIIKNRLSLTAGIIINGYNSKLELYPNEDLVFTSSWEPFVNAEMTIVLVFRETDGSYGGYAEKTFNSGSFAQSEAWTLFASDITCYGQRLAESDDAPEFEPRVRQFRLPREWFNGTSFFGMINDTQGELRVTTNGSVRTETLAPGEVYTVRTRDWSSSSRWGNRQPVIIQLEGWDDDGRYIGICERHFYPTSDGVRSQFEAVAPSSLYRR